MAHRTLERIVRLFFIWIIVFIRSADADILAEQMPINAPPL